MNIVTFTIVIVELAMFCFQVIYFLSRPSDKSRLWFLILLYLLIQYNIVSGLVPAPGLPFPIKVQHIIAYFTGFVMSVYLPFYIYKAFDLKQLKFFAYWGSLLFIFLPFLLVFITTYVITDDYLLSRRLVVIIPLIYAMVFYYSLVKAVKKKYFSDPESPKEPLYKEKIIAIFTALTLWISLPFILLFESANELLTHSFTNAGLLVMTLIYIRSTIYNAKVEYHELQTLNNSLAQKVKERTQQLEKINEEKTNTFINLAHETKTPLTLIRNYLEEYINKNPYSEELGIIHSNINKLTNDIVNFFDMQRFNKGMEVYDHQQITDFSHLLKTNLPVFKSFASKKSQSIADYIEESVYVKAAPDALSRILNNLVDNAIKYTPEKGTISILLHTQFGKVYFSVIDNGDGIPEEDQEKIFSPYYQINKIKRNTQGLGMGLAIVKKISDSIGGTITINSNPEENSGTEITLIFPQYSLSDNESLEAFDGEMMWWHQFVDQFKGKVQDVVHQDERPCLLVVEDHSDMLSYLVEKLGEKYNVYAARNGKEALDKLETINHLDLIISDIMMDEMNGFEFLSTISRSEKYQHLPFIFLTAKNNNIERLYGLKLGAIDYISKPFNIRELTEKTDAILENLNNQRRAIVNNAYRSIMTGNNDASHYNEPVVSDNKDPFDHYGLTTREKEIVQHIHKGHTQKVIAEALHISTKTVSKHIQNIYGKVNVTNKMELLQKLELIQS